METSLFEIATHLAEPSAMLKEAATTLGCTYYYNYSFPSSNYDVCEAGTCAYNNNCSHNCCNNYYATCNDYYCGSNASDLAWLWWSLAFFFLFLCLCSMCLRIKRRRMVLARMQAQAHSEHQTATTTTTYY